MSEDNGYTRDKAPAEAEAEHASAPATPVQRAPSTAAEQAQSREWVQLKGDGEGDDIRRVAAHGVSGAGGALPHLQQIQSAFGRHDVSGVGAHVGGRAAEATQMIGAEAYAADDQVAFREQPDLHTAAHEAAHVVQQRAGVSLKGGVGTPGDRYEQHADAVADAVVAGRSAEGLLDQHVGGGGGAVQRKAATEVMAPDHEAIAGAGGPEQGARGQGEDEDEDEDYSDEDIKAIEAATGKSITELVKTRQDPAVQGKMGPRTAVQAKTSAPTRKAPSQKVPDRKTDDSDSDLEAYKASMAERDTFIGQTHKATDFQSTTRLGGFDATYSPTTGVLDIECRSSFNFVNGAATDYPSATAAQLTWTDEAKQQWEAEFLRRCSAAWSGNHTFYCTRDWWEDLTARVTVRFTSTTANPHFTLNITKIPPNAFARSAVGRPTRTDDEYTPGYGRFDSNDLDLVNKPGGQQRAAVHEAGHMLGLDDEYGTGTPSHSHLAEDEHGHSVARGEDGRIMSGGSAVQPEHGVTFLEALKTATGMAEWASSAKDPRPLPSGLMGDFPTPGAGGTAHA